MSLRNYLKTAFGIALVAGVLTASGAGPAIAQGPLRPLEAFITNTSDEPVPVAVTNIPQTTPPLWQGTPFSTYKVVLNRDIGGVQECETSFTAAPQTAVLLKTVTGGFNVPPGGDGEAFIRITNLDASTTKLEIPMHRTAGALQAGGTYDGFSGSLFLDGYPVTKVESCVIGKQAALGISFVGFTVDLPQASAQ